MVNSFAVLGSGEAGYYNIGPLAETLHRLFEFDWINDAANTRISLGAVNVKGGTMRYFDSRKETIGAATVMASGAFPQPFPRWKSTASRIGMAACTRTCRLKR